MRSAIKDLSLRSSDGPPKIVAVIGDIMVDRYLTGRIERISPEAPVPVLVHNHERTVAGGAANVAMNIASLGCAVHLVGAIGSDADGEPFFFITGTRSIPQIGHLPGASAWTDGCMVQV